MLLGRKDRMPAKVRLTGREGRLSLAPIGGESRGLSRRSAVKADEEADFTLASYRSTLCKYGRAALLRGRLPYLKARPESKPSDGDSPSPGGEGRGEGELMNSRVREALITWFMGKA
jgi:hypothetical protein